MCLIRLPKAYNKMVQRLEEVGKAYVHTYYLLAKSGQNVFSLSMLIILMKIFMAHKMYLLFNSRGDEGENSDTHNEAQGIISSTKYIRTTVMCCASNTEGKECSQLYDYGNAIFYLQYAKCNFFSHID